MSDFRKHARNHLRTAAGTYKWAVTCWRGGRRRAGLSVFLNIPRIFSSVCGRLDDIVSLTIYLLNTGDLSAIRAVRVDTFTPQAAPASILIQTPGLITPDMLVELMPAIILYTYVRASQGQSKGSAT